MKKKIISALCFLAILFVAFSFVTKVNAGEGVSVSTISATQIRTTEPNGIRFVGKAEGLEEGKNYQFGFSLAKGNYSYEDMKAYTIAGKTLIKYVATSLDENGYFYASIVNIDDANLFTDITVLALVNDGETITYAGDNFSRNYAKGCELTVEAGYENANANKILQTISEKYVQIVENPAKNSITTYSALYDYNYKSLEKAFLEDWNKFFGTSLKEVGTDGSSPLYKSGSKGLTNSSSPVSDSNFYKFFNDKTYGERWGWLLDLIYDTKNTYSVYQINEIRGEGDKNPAGTKSYYCAHLASSICGFFNQACCPNGFTGYDFGKNLEWYDKISEYNDKVYTDASRSILVLSGSDYTLPVTDAAYNKTNYDFSNIVYSKNKNLTYTTSVKVYSEASLYAGLVDAAKTAGYTIEGKELTIDNIIDEFIKDCNAVSKLDATKDDFYSKYDTKFMKLTAYSEETGYTKGENNVMNDSALFAKYTWLLKWIAKNANNNYVSTPLVAYGLTDVAKASSKITKAGDLVYCEQLLLNNIANFVGKTYKHQSGASEKWNQTFDYSSVRTYNVNFTPTEFAIVYMDGESEITGLTNVKYTVEETLELETPVKSGFIFKGWYTESTFENQVTSITKGSFGKKTFYAKWDAASNVNVNVTFNLNEGAFKVAGTYDGVFKDSAALPLATKANCSFIGWKCNLDNKIYTEYPGYSSNPGDITYTAQFYELTKDGIISKFLEDVNASAIANKYYTTAITADKFYSTFKETFAGKTAETYGLFDTDTKLTAKYAWLLKWICAQKEGNARIKGVTNKLGIDYTCSGSAKLDAYSIQFITNFVHNFLNGTGASLHGGSSVYYPAADFTAATAYDGLIEAAIEANFIG